MFAILSFYDSKNDLRSIFSKSKISSERVPLPNGDVFFKVSVERKRGKIPWKKLSQCLGILREDVLISGDIDLPRNVGISKFVPKKYDRIMFFSSAVEDITSQGKTYNSLCVLDENALFMPFVTKVLPYFSQIKIITPLIEEYEKLSKELYLEYGISLLITPTSEPTGEIVISFDSSSVPVTFSGTLYTLHKRLLLSGRVLCPSPPALPSYCKELCPEGVDQLLFAAAVYEKCKNCGCPTINISPSRQIHHVL